MSSGNQPPGNSAGSDRYGNAPAGVGRGANRRRHSSRVTLIGFTARPVSLIRAGRNWLPPGGSRAASSKVVKGPPAEGRRPKNAAMATDSRIRALNDDPIASDGRYVL